MKNTFVLLSIFITLVSFSVEAKIKPYTVTLKVQHFESSKGIQGVNIELWSKEEFIAHQETDANGYVVFTDLTLETFQLKLNDTSGKYAAIYIERSGKYKYDDEEELMVAYYTKSYLKQYIKEKTDSIDQLYPPILKATWINCEDSLEMQAAFVGGNSEISRFIQENVYYPLESIELNESGRVYVNFVIETDGQVSHIKITKGVTENLDLEAQRLILRMPKWIPAQCNGEMNRVIMNLPINFSLQ